VTTTVPVERRVAVADFGERLSSLRLAAGSALSALRRSVARYGQLSPVHAFEQGGVLELFDVTSASTRKTRRSMPSSTSSNSAT
jgi:hypothetical protein